MDVAFPHQGVYSIVFVVYSQIHKKEEKPGTNYILGAGLQGDPGWPQGALVHISSFLNFQDLDSSLGSE